MLNVTQDFNLSEKLSHQIFMSDGLFLDSFKTKDGACGDMLGNRYFTELTFPNLFDNLELMEDGIISCVHHSIFLSG